MSAVRTTRGRSSRHLESRKPASPAVGLQSAQRQSRPPPNGREIAGQHQHSSKQRAGRGHGGTGRRSATGGLRPATPGPVPRPAWMENQQCRDHLSDRKDQPSSGRIKGGWCGLGRPPRAGGCPPRPAAGLEVVPLRLRPHQGSAKVPPPPGRRAKSKRRGFSLWSRIEFCKARARRGRTSDALTLSPPLQSVRRRTRLGKRSAGPDMGSRCYFLVYVYV